MVYRVSVYDLNKQAFIEKQLSLRALARSGMSIANRTVVDANGFVVGFVAPAPASRNTSRSA